MIKVCCEEMAAALECGAVRFERYSAMDGLSLVLNGVICPPIKVCPYCGASAEVKLEAME